MNSGPNSYRTAKPFAGANLQAHIELRLLWKALGFSDKWYAARLRELRREMC